MQQQQEQKGVGIFPKPSSIESFDLVNHSEGSRRSPERCQMANLFPCVDTWAIEGEACMFETRVLDHDFYLSHVAPAPAPAGHVQEQQELQNQNSGKKFGLRDWESHYHVGGRRAGVWRRSQQDMNRVRREVGMILGTLLFNRWLQEQEAVKGLRREQEENQRPVMFQMQKEKRNNRDK